MGAEAAALDLRQQEVQERDLALKTRARSHREDRAGAGQPEAGHRRREAGLGGGDRTQARETLERERAALESARSGYQDLAAQLPDLEAQATAALDRLTRAREQLREQLAEVHSYARQSREEVELARRQVQLEFERVRQQELALTPRDEHRLTVAAFRQQLIEWQGRSDRDEGPADSG